MRQDAHGVTRGGEQWNRYLQLRDLLRADPSARDAYAVAKVDLLAELQGNDDIRRACTDRKAPVIDDLLNQPC